MNRARLRVLLKALILVGVLLIPIAPAMRLRNEGFGDKPGSAIVSRFWQRAAYVMMPLGAGIAIVSGLVLVIVDRPKSKPG